MTADKWILDADLRPVPCHDFMRWAHWFEKAGEDRIVARTKIGRARISTVFLGLNHQWNRERPPLLFETMVFGGPLDGEMDRYTTWTDAEVGHAMMVRHVLVARRHRRDRLIVAVLCCVAVAVVLLVLGAILQEL